MDIYYMSDSIQYGSFRNPLYRDYEKFPYGTLENPVNSPPKSSQQLQKQQQQKDSYNIAQGKTKSKSKEPCPFCKEQKKRPLGAYLRKRGQRITSESISEDVEECVEEEQEESTGMVGGGSPSNNELAHTHHHHHHHHDQSNQVVGSGRYSRQESQDSDGK